MTWNHIEANPVTKPHCDAHFWTQDIEVGEVIGVWVALEDIRPGAGRLYVYPRSHELDMRPLLSDIKTLSRRKTALDVSGAEYQTKMVELIKAKGWQCAAPCVNAGDIILWDARTIHGSLPTSTPEFSRSSFTSHFSAAGGRFINARSRGTLINGVAVPFPRPRLTDFLRKLLGMQRA